MTHLAHQIESQILSLFLVVGDPRHRNVKIADGDIIGPLDGFVDRGWILLE
jgi:hypothetical protein